MGGATVRRHFGFSIVELMVTLSVAAILLAIASPSLAAFFRANRLATVSNELVLTLQLARAEATRRGRDVSVCFSTDGTACSGGTAWNGGWIVVQDDNNTGTPAPNAAGPIRVFDAVEPTLTLTAPAAYLRFHPDGTLDWTGATAGAIERLFVLSVTDCRGDQRRRISLTRLGRVRSAAVGCSA